MSLLEVCMSPVVSLVSTAVLISIVSFPSNDGSLPRLLKSLGSSVSFISSGFRIDRDRNTSISRVPVKLKLRFNCIDFRLFSKFFLPVCSRTWCPHINTYELVTVADQHLQVPIV